MNTQSCAPRAAFDWANRQNPEKLATIELARCCYFNDFPPLIVKFVSQTHILRVCDLSLFDKESLDIYGVIGH